MSIFCCTDDPFIVSFNGWGLPVSRPKSLQGDKLQDRPQEDERLSPPWCHPATIRTALLINRSDVA